MGRWSSLVYGSFVLQALDQLEAEIKNGERLTSLAIVLDTVNECRYSARLQRNVCVAEELF